MNNYTQKNMQKTLDLLQNELLNQNEKEKEYILLIKKLKEEIEKYKLNEINLLKKIEIYENKLKKVEEINENFIYNVKLAKIKANEEQKKKKDINDNIIHLLSKNTNKTFSYHRNNKYFNQNNNSINIQTEIFQ